MPYHWHFYDPLPYHTGWYPYRPVYPWWIDAAEFGAGYALGFYVANGRQVFYYYPEPANVSVSIDARSADDGSECLTEVPEVLEQITEDVPPAEEELILQEDGSIQADGTLTDAPAADIPLESVTDVPAPPQENAERSILEGSETEPELETGPGSELPRITRSEVDAAWKEIQAGDSAFAKGEMADAAAKYSGISETLPSMPDPWFRLAYTEMARGNYESASEYCLKGLRASRLWPASPFSLDYVYQGNTERKSEALAALEKAARAQTENAELDLLCGFAFYADGQNAKAAEFLKKAEKISPELAEFTEPVLKNIP